jgi:hypothetical protein
MIAPWYVRPASYLRELFENVRNAGVEFALLEDAQKGLLRLLSGQQLQWPVIIPRSKKVEIERILGFGHR